MAQMAEAGEGLAYPARGTRLPPDLLRPVGIEADCPGSASFAFAALKRMRARGWATYGNDGPRIGWIQRRPQHAVIGLMSVLSALMSPVPSVDPDRDAEGWLTVTVRAYPDGRGSIQLRGELDGAMDEAVRRLVTMTLAATVVRTWDPTIR